MEEIIPSIVFKLLEKAISNGMGEEPQGFEDYAVLQHDHIEPIFREYGITDELLEHHQYFHEEIQYVEVRRKLVYVEIVMVCRHLPEDIYHNGHQIALRIAKQRYKKIMYVNQKIFILNVMCRYQNIQILTACGLSLSILMWL